MPRRWILSAAERESLLALPDTQDDQSGITRSAKRISPSFASGEDLQTAWASRYNSATCASPASSAVPAIAKTCRRPAQGSRRKLE